MNMVMQKKRCRTPCDEGVHKALTDRCPFIQICFVSIEMMVVVGIMIMAFLVSLRYKWESTPLQSYAAKTLI